MIAVVMLAAAATVFAVAGDEGRETTDPAGAPWRANVRRSVVPAAYVAAWDRARNRTGCALLFPLDGGPELGGARAIEGKTPNDDGWDIFLTGESGTVEVLGLFDKRSRADRPTFTRSWPDGSVAKYGPDVGNAAPGSYDSNSLPFEAVLTLPDQVCAYRIYDTLGKDHLEFVFDRLRLMAPD